jgi:hypothetical protein
VLWPSTLRLSADYFESLTRFAVPLDERAIAALAHSAGHGFGRVFVACSSMTSSGRATCSDAQ